MQNRLIRTVVCGLCFAVTCRADESAIRRWLEHRRVAATDPLDLPGWEIVFEYRGPVEVSEAQLAQWKQKVQGLPDHPLRQDIAIAERRLSKGPDVDTYSLWTLSDDRWRMNVDSNYFDTFLDCGADGEELWAAEAQTLSIYDASTDAAIAEPVRQRLASAKSNLLLLIGEGGQLGRTANPELTAVHVQGNAWTAKLSNDRAWRWMLRGSFDPVDGGVTVNYIAEYSPRSTDPSRTLEFGPRLQAGDWGLVPGSLRMKTSLGTTEIRVISARKPAASDLRRITAVPSRQGGMVADPVRGERPVSRIDDYRNGEAVARVMGPDGETEIKLRPEHARFGGEGLRRVGWVGAAGAMALGVAIWIRRRRSA